jgi:hypothetical protein
MTAFVVDVKFKLCPLFPLLESNTRCVQYLGILEPATGTKEQELETGRTIGGGGGDNCSNYSSIKSILSPLILPCSRPGPRFSSPTACSSCGCSFSYTYKTQHNRKHYRSSKVHLLTISRHFQPNLKLMRYFR